MLHDEYEAQSEWFLPHFAVVLPVKSTLKVSSVFDGSAKYEGKSLNTETLKSVF